jgi:DNA-binding beta-propeller fold protein YncE
MKTVTRLFLLFFISENLILFTGCGSSRQLQTDAIVWPAPPDDPRVQYISTLRGEEDFSIGLSNVLDVIAGSEGKSGLVRPYDVCVDDFGRIYVTDVAQGVFVFDTLQKKSYVLGEKSSISLRDTRGIAYGFEKIFIGLADAGQVAVLDTGGTLLYTIGRQGQFSNPVDIAVDKVKHKVFVVDNTEHRIVVFSESGDSLFSLGKRGLGEGEFNFPQSIAIDNASNIYVVDAFNFRIEIFDSTMKYVKSFGQQGDIFGTFSRPKGIALDTYNNIYVLDANHNNFQIFNNSAELLLFVGKFSSANDGFQSPVSIAISENNTIFVTDQVNKRVQIFQLLKGN